MRSRWTSKMSSQEPLTGAAYLHTIFWQSLFMPGLKVKPLKRWVDELGSVAATEPFAIQRRGRHLSCLRLPAPQQLSENKHRTAILAHPMRRYAKYWFKEGQRIRIYHDLGYDVVLFDYNGFGESDRIDLFFWRDAEALIRHMSDDTSNDHLILHGVSFGAYHMLRALSALPIGSGVVVETANRSMLDYWGRWPGLRTILKFQYDRGHPVLREYDVIDALRSLNRSDLRVQFIACGEDRIASPEEMADLAECLALEVEKVLTVFQGVGHMEAPQADLDKFRSVLMSVANREP